MSVFFRRGKWVGRNDKTGSTKRFVTEQEAIAFAQDKPAPAPAPEPKKVVPPTLGEADAKKEKDDSKKDSSKETTNTYKTTPLRFSKGYGKKKV